MLLSRGLFLLALVPGSVFAQQNISGAREREPVQTVDTDQGPGHGNVRVQLGFYDHSDNGDGNPFLDEDLTVIEPVVVFDYDATDRLSWGGTFSFDYVSSASIDRLSEFDGQSGASGDTYFGADFNAAYKTSESWTLGGRAGFSFEYDYTSFGFGTAV